VDGQQIDSLPLEHPAEVQQPALVETFPEADLGAHRQMGRGPQGPDQDPDPLRIAGQENPGAMSPQLRGRAAKIEIDPLGLEFMQSSTAGAISSFSVRNS